MADLKFPQWERQYREARAESDCQKLLDKISLAETAIFHRLHDDLSRMPFPQEESAAICNALLFLRIMRGDPHMLQEADRDRYFAWKSLRAG
jgi:hypothetical protein